MKKSTLLLLFMFLLAANSCRKQETTPNPDSTAKPDPILLDEFIVSKLKSEGRFLWAWASDDFVWAALSNSDYILSVGYRPENENNVENKLHLLDLKTPEWRQAQAAVLKLVLDHERALNPALKAQELIAFPEEVLPVVDVYVRNPATIAALRASKMVRYAEPMGYEPFQARRAAERSDSGCGSNYAQTGLIAGTDYTTISPNGKQPWNHVYHNLSTAWTRSTGKGAKVMIIDTGSKDGQENLGSAFNQGASSGRTLERRVTLPRATFLGIPTGPFETPNDLCGHGTSMAGACAAPRGTDGAATGVAYNCNLVTVRAAQDVYLDESRESKGVADAYTLAGNTASVKITSMSLGRLTSSSQISDAIKYAYGKGKMIICAAGTSFDWSSWFVGVIFPASMPEAIAVTGIQDNLSNACNSCHTGGKVDFVVVMEKASNELHVPTLADSGDAPATVGGSSVATASTSGMAALIWAKYPSWTRQQVYDRMKSSANYYPGRNGSFGWGRIDGAKATL
jgi:subtilisin family serine protease